MPNYFWSTTGNNGNAGTQLAPKRDLAAVLPLLVPGDFAYGRGGTYFEDADNTIPSGLSWNSKVTIAAFPLGNGQNEPVILKPNVGKTFVLHFVGAACHYIEINGISLDAINCTADVVKITTDTDEANTAHHIRLLNCEVKNSLNNGVYCGGEIIGGNEFIGLDVHGNARFTAGSSPFNAHGFYIAGSNNLVDLCRVHDQAGNVDGYQIQIYHSGSLGVNSNIVRRTSMYGNSNKAGLVLSSGVGHQAYDCIIFNSGAGIVIFNGSDHKALSNTVYGCAGRSIEIKEFGVSNALVDDNICFNNGTNTIIDMGAGSVIGPKNLIGIDPKFVDPTNGDFNLKSGSPAIGTGTDYSIYFNYDYYSNTRIAGAWDIGAVAKVASATVPKTASDNLIVSLNEARTLKSLLSRADSLLVSLGESAVQVPGPVTTVALSRSDILGILFTEATTILSILARVDSITISASDISTLLAYFSVADNLTVSISEAAATIVTDVIKLLSASDDLTISIQDALNAILSALTRTDDLTTGFTDSIPISSSLNRTDTISLSLTTVVRLVVFISALENLGVEFIETGPLLPVLDESLGLEDYFRRYLNDKKPRS